MMLAKGAGRGNVVGESCPERTVLGAGCLRRPGLHSLRKCLSEAEDLPSAHSTHTLMGTGFRASCVGFKIELQGRKQCRFNDHVGSGPNVQSWVNSSFGSFSESGLGAFGGRGV